jgi:hypothetical protein
MMRFGTRIQKDAEKRDDALEAEVFRGEGRGDASILVTVRHFAFPQAIAATGRSLEFGLCI